ncbi:MAG TPA: type II toxin-antitoxin system VapC family toxin [Candidatus Bathyarchaeia archaeon]|nr:type II toxin-antitoxin system VapC family toxin [Candidatus Bathyarchaeia archaeon]
MIKIVLDTSVIVKWFSQEKEADKAEELLCDLREEKVQILLPELVKYELANALLKGKKLNSSQAQKALAIFYRLPVLYISESESLAFSSYKMAQDLNITYYDACFLALARAEKAVLVTANPKHQAGVKGIKITKLQDY